MQKKLLLIHGIILIILWVLAITTHGFGGGGDSLTHYFIAKSSWKYPSSLLDQWGKPIFTLVASPFAQFGFVSMKMFIAFCAVLASYFTSLTAIKLNRPLSWTIPIIAFVGPAFYAYIMSGLTEPFAALLSVFAVWCCLSKRVSLGFFAASFLPFARSEATVFLVFFLLFGILNGHYKKLPLLISGYLIYGVVGWFVYHNFFWVFSTPYDPHSSPYGHGNWFHYFDSLQKMLAIPAATLAILGVIQFFRRWFILHNINWRTEPWLVHALFVTLFAGHTLVWVLGIYGSAGLERTLITAFPFLWLIMHDGLLFLRDVFYKISRKTWHIAAITLVSFQIINIFFSHPVTYYYWDALITPGSDNRFFKENVVQFIHKKYPFAKTFVLDKPDMAVYLDVNFQDYSARFSWASYRNLESVPDNAVWVFDNYYVITQYGITEEKITKDGKLKAVESFTAPSGSKYIIYKKVTPNQS